MAATAVALALFPAGAQGVELRRIATLDSPTYLTAPRGDHKRVFVTEQDGVVRVIKRGRVVGRPFLDISGSVSSGGERGLLSIAFDPGYQRNRRFYTYSTDNQGDISVDAFKRNSRDRQRANFNSRENLFEVQHRAAANHNGGQLQFGPDGLLYAGTGDGGEAFDPPNNAQNPNSLLGKLLRIDAGEPGARPQVFALGLRNPYRFSFDRLNGALVIGDVGQSEREEVDYGSLDQLRGANFGWKCREGSIATRNALDPDLPCTPAGKVVDPIFEYSHARGGCAITGGYVVRDRRLTGLFGRYVYGDFCAPRLRSIEAPSGRDDRPLPITVESLSSFGEDAGGCLYAISLEGPIAKLVPDSGGSRKPC